MGAELTADERDRLLFDLRLPAGILALATRRVATFPFDFFYNWCLPIRRFYEIPSRLQPQVVVPLWEGDVAIFGLGGCIGDQTSASTGYYSRSLAEYYLRPLLTCRLPRRIILVSDPPESWQGDLAGACLADALITAYHPEVCVAGRPGVKGPIQRVGDTLLIHPGELSSGCAAWLDLGLPKDEQVKLLHFKSQEPTIPRS